MWEYYHEHLQTWACERDVGAVRGADPWSAFWETSAGSKEAGPGGPAQTGESAPQRLVWQARRIALFEGGPPRFQALGKPRHGRSRSRLEITLFRRILREI